MRDRIRGSCLVLLFVLVNIAIAAPVSAGMDNSLCAGDGGGLVPCCTRCLVFCHCTVQE